MLPRRRLLSAAAGGLALSTLGGRRVLRAAETPDPLAPDPLAPWAAAPAAADHPDPRIRAMHWAVLAPNPHNRQPWLLELVGQDGALLRCDLDRRLPATDPFDRQVTIGLGAFLELFRMAAAAQGLALETTPFPEGEPEPRLDARPVARLRLVPGGVPDPLFAATPHRRSAKRPFDPDRPVAPEAMAALAAAVRNPVDFGATGAPDRVAALRDLTWRAWMAELGAPEQHMETVRLMRLGRAEVARSPDGVSVWGPPFEEMVARGEITREGFADPGHPAHGAMVAMYRRMLAATPAHLWLTSPDNSRATQLGAGRDWLRVNLAATALGLGLQPVSQALQEFPAMAGPYAEVHAMLAPGGGRVQMLGRLGHLPRHLAHPGAPTPRWPAESRILRG